MADERTKPQLRARDIGRYQRQIVLPEVGIEGQLQLLESRVLVVGAGALGSAAATYLAAAGVGTLGLVDGDVVDLSNLHRQILHDEAQIGRLKTDSGAKRLKALNPHIDVVEHSEFLSSENVLRLFSEYDLIVNGSDNFPTRYLVNDAAVLLRKPLIDAAILRFEGHLAVFQPGHGCYRCLFPTPPPEGTVPNCAQAGILGAVAGVLGSMQAVEALKVLLGLNEGKAGTLLLYEALSSNWRRMPFDRDPDCAVCGDDPSVTQPIDYDAFCGVGIAPLGRSQPVNGAVSDAASSAVRDTSTSQVTSKAASPAGGTTISPEASSAGGTTVDLAASKAAHDTASKAISLAGMEEFSVGVEQALSMVTNRSVTVMDVRQAEEFAGGHVPGAVHCALEDLDVWMENHREDTRLLVVCAAGVRSAHAAKYLRSCGYTAWTLIGGTGAWVAAGCDITT
jgi:sulfur-carrier protein adenylyltransferase/sulfurtransferase